MIETKTIDPEYLESVFFSKPYKFSFTSGTKLWDAPKIFYQEYILKQREIRDDKHLTMGKLIHFLVLEDEGFDDHFTIMPEGVPTGKGKDVVDLVYAMCGEREMDTIPQLIDLKDEVLEAMKEIDLYQNLKDDSKHPFKTGDEKRLDKVITPKMIEYFKFLTEQTKKTLVDSGMMERATIAANMIKDDEKIAELLGLGRENDVTKYVAYNEYELEMELEGMPFGLKGIVDNMTVDVEKKLITVNDVKTTGKGVTNFPESVEYWRYWLQGAIYVTLAQSFFAQYIEDLDKWTVKLNFIVIDNYNQLYAYPVSDETLNKWLTDMQDVFKRWSYHLNTRDFKLPYEFATGSVEL